MYFIRHKGHSKLSKSHTERRAIAENFCFGNILALLIKLEQQFQIYLTLKEIICCLK